MNLTDLISLDEGWGLILTLSVEFGHNLSHSSCVLFDVLPRKLTIDCWVCHISHIPLVEFVLGVRWNLLPRFLLRRNFFQGRVLWSLSRIMTVSRVKNELEIGKNTNAVRKMTSIWLPKLSYIINSWRIWRCGVHAAVQVESKNKESSYLLSISLFINLKALVDKLFCLFVLGLHIVQHVCTSCLLFIHVINSELNCKSNVSTIEIDSKNVSRSVLRGIRHQRAPVWSKIKILTPKNMSTLPLIWVCRLQQ